MVLNEPLRPQAELMQRTGMDEEHTTDVVCGVRKRARKARLFAQIGVIVIILIVATMIWYFSTIGSGYAFSEWDAIRFKPEESSWPPDITSRLDKIETLINQQLSKMWSSIANTQGLVSSIIVGIITRLAYVVIAVYLIQILIWFHQISI